MDSLITTIIVGVSLSMDAFSLALAYGTYGLSSKEKIILSVIVGCFHFFMPLLGLYLGNVIFSYFVFNLKLVVSVIFSIIGISMIISSINDNEQRIMVSIFGFIIFGFSVSIDSFTTGIGLNSINSNYLQVSIIFAFISGIFTYIGLLFGIKLNENFGKWATFIGGIVLIFMGLYYLFSLWVIIIFFFSFFFFSVIIYIYINFMNIVDFNDIID